MAVSDQCMHGFRSVYDAANPAQFLQQLDARIRSHDKEIERMCNYHYQGFIESIRGLLQVRTDAVNLKVKRGLTFAVFCVRAIKS